MKKLKPFAGVNKGSLSIIIANKEYEIMSESSVFVNEDVMQNTSMGSVKATRRVSKLCYKIITEDKGIMYYSVDTRGQQYELIE